MAGPSKQGPRQPQGVTATRPHSSGSPPTARCSAPRTSPDPRAAQDGRPPSGRSFWQTNRWSTGCVIITPRDGLMHYNPAGAGGAPVRRGVVPGGAAGAPIVLILAFVFPAIVAAALALAYYGFQYADSMSRPIEVLFRDTSRDEAEKASAELEARVDRAALALFDQIAVEKKEPNTPAVCDADPGPAIESYAVLGAARLEECHWPARP